MINLLKKQWWKYTAALILLYVLIGGLLVPLGPGLRTIYPVNISSDTSVNFTVTGYHTHFADAGDLQVWFKPTTGAEFYCSDSVVPADNNTAHVLFHFPKKNLDSQHNKNFDLILNDKLDGTLIMSYAAVVTAKSTDDSAAVAKVACTPEVDKAKFTGFAFPYREILFQSIRNTFYHVPMWFAMMFLLIFSLVYSIRYLNTGDMEYDVLASQAVNAALLFGAMGLMTGMMWATYTWGKPWPNDPKLNGAAVGVMIYLAYIVLRGSLTDEIQRAKISAVYSVFAIVIFVLFIFIIPRLTSSLHPGNGGNPAFSKYDLDSHLRMFFYPAVIGWTMLGFWIMSVGVRIRLLQLKKSSQ
jgi:heme exporter protein C